LNIMNKFTRPYLVLYFEIFIYSYCSNKYFLWGFKYREIVLIQILVK